jgi:hypothetical protein
VSHKAIGDPGKLDFSGKHNDKVVQKDNTELVLFPLSFFLILNRRRADECTRPQRHDLLCAPDDRVLEQGDDAREGLGDPHGHALRHRLVRAAQADPARRRHVLYHVRRRDRDAHQYIQV